MTRPNADGHFAVVRSVRRSRIRIDVLRARYRLIDTAAPAETGA